jgi:hypothetical protein
LRKLFVWIPPRCTISKASLTTPVRAQLQPLLGSSPPSSSRVHNRCAFI